MAFKLVEFLLDTCGNAAPSDASVALGIYLLCRDEETTPSDAMIQVAEFLDTYGHAAILAGKAAAQEEAVLSGDPVHMGHVSN